MNVFISFMLIPMGCLIEKDREDLFIFIAYRHKYTPYPFVSIHYPLIRASLSRLL